MVHIQDLIRFKQTPTRLFPSLLMYSHQPDENECFILFNIQVAKYNKKDPPSAAELEVELQELRKNHPKEESLLKVMSYPKLRQRAILLFFIS